jgi:hypothetical protein
VQAFPKNQRFVVCSEENAVVQGLSDFLRELKNRQRRDDKQCETDGCITPLVYQVGCVLALAQVGLEEVPQVWGLAPAIS